MSDSSRVESNLPSRRSIAKAAAWAAPTIALAVAAPAHAVSAPVQPAGLQGWIAFQHPNQGTTSNYTVRGYNSGQHDYGTYGLWVTNTTVDSTVTDIKILLHYTPAPDSWSPVVPTANWNGPTHVGTTEIGGVAHETYELTYAGQVTPTDGVTKIQNDMHYRANQMYFDSRPSFFIDRYVTVDDVVLGFRRGRDQRDYTILTPGTPDDTDPNLPGGRNARSAEVAPADADQSISVC